MNLTATVAHIKRKAQELGRDCKTADVAELAALIKLLAEVVDTVIETRRDNLVRVMKDLDAGLSANRDMMDHLARELMMFGRKEQ